MPTARLGLATSVVNGIIYAMGGGSEVRQPLSIVEAYDPATDTWTKKAGMPTARCGPGTCLVNGKIYAIGGATGYDLLSTIEIYEPIKDTWTSKTSMFEPRFASFSMLNEKIYAIGGALTIKPPHPAVSTVEEYALPKQ